MERTHLEQWKAREVSRLLALVETERRYYQEIVASVPVGLLVLAPDLTIVSSNREVRKIFGLRGSDAIRGSLDTLLPPEFLDQVRGVLKTGDPQYKIAVQTEREGGKHLLVSIQAIRNWDDETEQEALLTIEELSGMPSPAVAAEIPEKTGLEAAGVPASELLENLDAIVWAVELPTKRFLYVNDKAQSLLGYPAERWLSEPGFWETRIHPEDREWVLQSYERALQNWTRHSCEYRAQTSYGKVVWLRETARLLHDQDGQTKHLIGIAVEVSQRRILEHQMVQSQRIDALGKLGSRVSREIHGLLTVISGYGEELMQAVPGSHPLHSDLEEILSATDGLRVIANQLALFSRRPTVTPAPLDLGAFLTRIEPGLRTAAGDKVAFELKMFPASIGIHADGAHLEQLLMALAQRAGREMSAGGKLTIECSPLEITEDLRRDEAVLRPGVYAVISVEDTGPTPDPEARAAMFEWIATPSETRDEDGPVLSRIYGFVRQWGGDISVSVNSPQGAVFEIYIPRMGETAKQPDRPAEPIAQKPVADEAIAHEAISNEPTAHQPLVDEPVSEEAPEPAPSEPEPVAQDAPEAAPSEPEPVAQHAPEAAPSEPEPVAAPPRPEPVPETILIAEPDAGIRAVVKKILRRQNYTVLEAGSSDEAQKAASDHSGKIDLLITDVSTSQFEGEKLAKKLMEQHPGARVLYLSGYTDDPSSHSGEVPSGAASLQKPFTLGSLLTKVKELLDAH